ncbi:MAG: integration host factor subunit beta [Treponema sp.]|jgi:nucleoid DNA-binding protein|nr:integration host factor subunit beta [Treponema sp.]
MNKPKFTRNGIRAVMIAAGIEPEQARTLTANIIEAMAEALAAGKVIELRGLGSLEVRERKAHKARNPKTGEPIIALARRRVVFHPGRELKAALRKPPGTAR